MRKRIFVILAAAVAATASTTSRAQPTDELSVQSALESAATAIHNDDFAEGMRLLDIVERHEPDNPWLWFYRGVAQLGREDWYRALESFDRARDLLNAAGQSDPTLLELIEGYRRRARGNVFSLSFRAGLAYDSNVTFLGSGGAGFEISGRADAKFMTRFQFAYAPVATKEETLSFAVRAADTWNFSVEDFNHQIYGAAVRYDRRLDDHWQAGFEYNYDISYLNNESFLSRHSLSPELTYAWTPSDGAVRPYESTLYYRIEFNDFLFDTQRAFDRDGFANAVGLVQTFWFNPLPGRNWTWDITAGYEFQDVVTEGREFDRFVHLFRLGFGLPLPNPWLPRRDARFSINADWELADYIENSIIDADRDERHDLITTLTAAFSHQLAENPDTGDLFVHTIVSWSDADSNVTTRDGRQPFTYNRWFVGLQLEWAW